MQWNKLENGANQTYHASGCYTLAAIMACFHSSQSILVATKDDATFHGAYVMTYRDFTRHL